ncbi:MAG: hypothetical protein IJZ74_07925, partial [Clostridia bacterium]|nr:hypothetical protein [Clostridia bacterium]
VIHSPALSVQEAAMLPALSSPWEGTPRNLLIPTGHLDFRKANVDGGGRPVDNFSARRGTMAGRALLSYVKSAPAQRRRR